MRERPYVRCLVRRKDVVATPEEHARQWLVHWLMTERGYTANDMDVEYKLKRARSGPRADIVIFQRQRHRHVYIIVECKRADASAAVYERAEVQLRRYVREESNALYGVIFAGPDRCYVIAFVDNAEGNTVTRVPKLLGELERFPHADAPVVGRQTFVAVPREIPSLTLEQHACLTCELHYWPERAAEILAKYGVTPEQKVHSDQQCEASLRDPALRHRWEQARASYEASLRWRG